MTEILSEFNGNKKELCEKIKTGEAVWLKNVKRKIRPLGIGSGFPTRVNINLGTSTDVDNPQLELKKLETAEKYGADTVMDLSTGKDIAQMRKLILNSSSIPVGTVPVYEAAAVSEARGRDFSSVSGSEMIELVEKQASEGVDFMTVHAGITLRSVMSGLCDRRKLGSVSRGGSLLISWMKKNRKENPFFENFSQMMQIFRKYHVVLSLGDGLRPGCLHDATDSAQISELLEISELRRTAVDQGVGVIIEGPGHIPLSEITANVLLQKKLCGNAPFYVLGPIPLDTAPGYDHITSAIGGAVAAAAGADFICCVTPAEHLKLPDLSDIKEGVIAARIAAETGDYEKKRPETLRKNWEMSEARAELNWEWQQRLSLDPEKFAAYRNSCILKDEKTCSMCGNLCAVKRR